MDTAEEVRERIMDKGNTIKRRPMKPRLRDKRVQCPVCKTKFIMGPSWPYGGYCSTACFYQGAVEPYDDQTMWDAKEVDKEGDELQIPTLWKEDEDEETKS
jgi:hypothetical protein